MIQFISLYVTPKQDYLHSIHLHSFSFLYFKTSKQRYLIPFHSFHLLKYIPFHSHKYISFYSISLIFIPL